MDNREEFEAKYLKHMHEQWPEDNATIESIRSWRRGSGYGSDCTYLAGAWWGWQAALSRSQDTFQARVHPWMLACFGAEIAADRQERNHRFFEEAAELVQACGMTASEAHQLVEYTWSRPVGEKNQEAGGVMVTLAALCLANGLDMHAAGELELERISAPETMAKIRAKQAAKPKHSPLPEARSQDVARVAETGPNAFDWLETEITAVDCWHRGDPSYEHDAHWMKDKVLKLIGEARKAFIDPQPSQAGSSDELASMTRMFNAACADLGAINEALGLDPDDGGAEPILDAIAELKVERDKWVDANYAAPAAPDVAPIYQIMCTDDDDAEEHPHVRDLWMDVPKDAFDKLAKRGDMRARAVYATPAPAEPKGEQQADYEAKGTIDHLDLDNHRLRRAMQKIMARLAELLDEDQFANIESIVKGVGVEPKGEQRRNPPFANCSFRICDLPGQCRGEGKCHHPKGGRDSKPEQRAATLTAEQITSAADAESRMAGYGVDDGMGIPLAHWWTFDRAGLLKFAALLSTLNGGHQCRLTNNVKRQRQRLRVSKLK